MNYIFETKCGAVFIIQPKQCDMVVVTDTEEIDYKLKEDSDLVLENGKPCTLTFVDGSKYVTDPIVGIYIDG
jgi:hypothetical protein